MVDSHTAAASKTDRRRSLSQALATNVRHYAKHILSQFAIAAKTVKLFAPDHPNVAEALAAFEEALRSFIRLEGEVSIARMDEFLYLNEVPVRVDAGGLETYRFVLDLLASRGAGSFVFKEGISTKELQRFLTVLHAFKPGGDDPWCEFERALEEAALLHVSATRYAPQEEDQPEYSEDRRLIVISTYFRAVHLIQEAFESLAAGKRFGPKRLKRTVQAMIDMLLEDEHTLLALTHIKDYKSRLACHSANVAILSAAIGVKLGLPKRHLGDLTAAAMFHDVGKAAWPADRVAEPPGDADGLRRRIEEHTFGGVEALLSQRINDSAVKCMNVCFLHHLRYDGTGLPRTHVVRKQNLFSRIVSVADFYENETTSAAGKEARRPDEAMRALLDGAGTRFDPLLVKVFVNLLGLYPVGSLVCLTGGDVAVVVSPPADSRHLDRPVVRVFSDLEGRPKDETVNLLARGPDGGFLRSITKLYQQEEVELEMEEYLSVL